jgi:putative ABC transport system permease protein
VGPDYLKTMDIGLAAGREFSAMDRDGSQRVVILNEAFARLLFGSANPLGRRLRFDREDKIERTVVGVARDSRYSTLGESGRPALYEPYFQAGSARPAMNYLLRTNGPPQLAIKPLTTVLFHLDPAATVEAKPMSQAMAFALMPSRTGAVALGAAGLLGLLLASVGLYGVLSYSTSRRTREIGLRVALGARTAQVLRLVLAEGACAIVAGLAVGMALALWVTRPLAMFLVPGLEHTDPPAYLAVAVILLLVGCVASVVPALRALGVDPIAALRHD